ncbi:hypothetical protein [Cupriavidus plantarum]|uniref:hypothetical protein n=1 Tax=Cupriavidus plantarum TaxID=942865 RepID=UPI001B10579F|nr:hypothetical protein [Cupriavidus plantarum]CAG2137801.1 hypothetical protein LMG26296_02611 [Cupriavidus plantarum]SMR84986.1 hypothetical protein SAMN05421735_3781 [Cupriavidus plantarum]
MYTKLAKTLFVVSTMTFGLSQAAHAAWSDTFVPASASTKHVSTTCKLGGFDPYTDGTRMGPRDPYTDGGNRIGMRDTYTDGARAMPVRGECASHLS